jgi:hypothetical protein
MLLRCLQATGSASTVALGNLLKRRQLIDANALMMASGAGIIGDIATPAERGGFFGLFGLGALVCACGLRFEKFQIG